MTDFSNSAELLVKLKQKLTELESATAKGVDEHVLNLADAFYDLAGEFSDICYAEERGA